eukprot:m.102446 g.102446  ORF g.102446 m.102446 type:complete len:404 (-) comp16822_c0_seq1:107-1318(-)
MASIRSLCALQQRSWSGIRRGIATSASFRGDDHQANKPATAVVMMNMGGPSTPEETGPFLKRLFQDGDIIDLGGGFFQKHLGEYIAKRRTPKVQQQYEEINGSPIRHWTEEQGKAMCDILDKQHPETAPHKAYTAFRYAHPLTEEALEEMKRDGVKRAIAFSQFPQWSCTTSGSSMNDLWRKIKSMDLEDQFSWSLIDRWPLHTGYVDAVVDRIREKMEEFDEADREKVILVFSAHSVPMKVVEKGDHYVTEVAASVKAVMEKITEKVKANSFEKVSVVPKHVMCWQSKVGFLPWMTPQTGEAIKSLGKRNEKHLLVVPIAFTSDHIETLFEIGMEYAEEAAEEGITHFKMTEGLNGSRVFAQALADIVSEHLDSGELHSPQYKLKCFGCTKPLCRQVLSPAV